MELVLIAVQSERYILVDFVPRIYVLCNFIFILNTSSIGSSHTIQFFPATEIDETPCLRLGGQDAVCIPH